MAVPLYLVKKVHKEEGSVADPPHLGIKKRNVQIAQRLANTQRIQQNTIRENRIPPTLSRLFTFIGISIFTLRLFTSIYTLSYKLNDKESEPFYKHFLSNIFRLYKLHSYRLSQISLISKCHFVNSMKLCVITYLIYNMIIPWNVNIIQVAGLCKLTPQYFPVIV